MQADSGVVVDYGKILGPHPPCQPEEYLYRAVKKRDQWAVAFDEIPFPDISVNRERYSRPEDILSNPKFHDSSVAKFQVSDVPTPFTTGDGKQCEFRAEHDPLPDNYSHTEIRCYKEGIHLTTSKKIPPAIKLEFRQRLAEKMRPAIP